MSRFLLTVTSNVWDFFGNFFPPERRTSATPDYALLPARFPARLAATIKLTHYPSSNASGSV
jgi:hypothetical protein